MLFLSFQVVTNAAVVQLESCIAKAIARRCMSVGRTLTAAGAHSQNQAAQPPTEYANTYIQAAAQSQSCCDERLLKHEPIGVN